MPRTILYPSCPACGSVMRSQKWREGMGGRPVTVACEATFERRSIQLRPLELGEQASLEAEVVVGADAQERPVFASAAGAQAPAGWLEEIGRAIERAARALGFFVAPDASRGLAQQQLTAPLQTRAEFEARAGAYLQAARDSIDDAKRELKFREGEVEMARQTVRFVR